MYAIGKMSSYSWLVFFSQTYDLYIYYTKLG